MPKLRVRYQIFVSSTYKDLLDERQAAVEAILRAGHIPAGMELFAAQNKPQMDVIKEWIEESDIFCLILGARYGSIEPESGKSYVECEYDHAVALRKPMFSLVLDEKLIDANVQKLGRKVALEQENEACLKSFHKRITNTLVRMVTSFDSIKVAIFEAIGALERVHEIEGWVRAKDAHMPPQMGEEFARLSAENARLAKEITIATAAREELIDGRSLKDWVGVLSQFSFGDWDQAADQPRAEAKISFHSALIRYGHELGAGVTNGATASSFQAWLYGFASALASLGLVETKKVPASVYWQRLGLSTAGKRLYVALMAQNSQGKGFVATTDLATEFLAVIRREKARRAASQGGAQTKTNDEVQAERSAPPVSREVPTEDGAQKKPKKNHRRS